jgi:alcohol dehydrogenase class IV
MEQFLPSFTWNNPTRVIFGAGRLAELRGLVDEISGEGSRIFLVTGRSSLKARGILQRVLDALGEGRITLFDQASPYPSPDLADVATAQCREAGCEVVVAIGGGSVMDLAKVVALLSNKEGAAQEFSAGERVIEGPGLPFIAVPTTSGSSSEVTMSSALWDREGKQHMGLSSRHMFPTVAIVDPEMTMSMSKTLAAVTGMDAVTSAIESYWSTEAEPMTDGINLQVIQMFHINLNRSSIQGDIESRANCAMAATMSGIAYSNSRPNACHAVGIPLTLYWDVEHGQAVSVTLTSFLRWAAPGIPHKMPALYAALGAQDLDGACARITQIMTRCGLETKLSGLGLGEGDVDTLVESTRWDRTRTLPRPLGRDDLRGLLTELL